ncbi:hypothetical protein ACBJ59_57850 [Nonomuraea sp. MTCD27]|uniref:hypothetical protein n=1 Tax=Nonomuraea sp. MTCD27 TaxID=1676747 RepID=UPI0035BF2A3A
MLPGDRLIEKILDDETSARARDKATSYLLQELGKGYPIANLARLLTSANSDAVRAGAWLLAEQGRAGIALRDLVVALLDHPVDDVRFWALDSLTAWATVEDGAAVAAAIGKVVDASPAVRWKALHFLAATGPSELEAGAAALTDDRLRAPTLWLAGQRWDSFDRVDILARLGNENRLIVAFAAAAAKRVHFMDRSLLEHAARVTDEESAVYAQRGLEY